VIDCEDMQPWEVIALHCGAPEHAARAGVEVLLRLKVLVHNGRQLVAPKFLEAQEATKSDKLRAKESRARKASEASAAPIETDRTSRIVTAPSHSETPESRPVTSGHAESHGVTLCCAVHGFASPCLACSAHARELGEASDPSDPESRSTPEQRAILSFDRRLWEQWTQALKLEQGGSPNHDALRLCKPALPAAESEALRVFRAAADAYVADRKAKNIRPQFHFFAKDFTDWVAAAQAPCGARSSTSITRAMTQQEAIDEAARTPLPEFLRGKISVKA
jgi:hypothetical protein